MLNNKGFTIVEVVISFTFVVIILASLFAVVINYQNETTEQQVKSNLLVFKNNMLQIIYNDIIGENMESITSCGNKCININTKTEVFQLSAINQNGIEYLNYRNTKYELPDSINGLSQIGNFVYEFDTANKIYYVTIPLRHGEMTNEENEQYSINILVSGKELVR